VTVIWTDKKLQVHPMMLFATVAFLDGSLFWLYLMEPNFCPQTNHWSLFGLVTFPRTFWVDNDERKYNIIAGFANYIHLLERFLYTSTMIFNTCICFDLILMIKYPFDGKSKRIVKYYLWAVGGGILAVAEDIWFP